MESCGNDMFEDKNADLKTQLLFERMATVGDSGKAPASRCDPGNEKYDRKAPHVLGANRELFGVSYAV